MKVYYCLPMIVQFYQFLQDRLDSAKLIDSMFYLLLLPFLLVAVEIVQILVQKRKRPPRVFVLQSNLILLFYLAIQIFLVPYRSLPVIFALALLAKILYIFLEILLQALTTKQKKKLRLVEDRRKEERQEGGVDSKKDLSLTQPFAYTSSKKEEQNDLQADIQFTYIDQILEDLKEKQLSAGDRLECKKMEDILMLYKVKSTFTQNELTLLNDILSSLLKMMAKYAL